MPNRNSQFKHRELVRSSFFEAFHTIYGAIESNFTSSNRYFEREQHCYIIICINTLILDIARAYTQGSETDQNFVLDLAMFFLGFFKNHLGIVEKKPELHPILLEAHNILVRISQVPDVEVFKVALEYWNMLATDLHHESAFLSAPLLLGVPVSQSPRRVLYGPVLSRVRTVMVSRMAKPEEVCNVVTTAMGDTTTTGDATHSNPLFFVDHYKDDTTSTIYFDFRVLYV